MTRPAIEVRLATPEDLETAGEVVRAAYFALPDYPRDREYDQIIGDVAGRAAHSTVVVAVAGERIVGCLTYLADSTHPDAEHGDPDAATFRYFGVHPDAQGLGVGAAMVAWCEQQARRDGLRRIRIHTLESMPAAQRLYLHLGFERDEANDEDWDGIRGLAYVRHLPSA